MPAARRLPGPELSRHTAGMNLQRSHLDAAAAAGLIDTHQAQALWRFLEEQAQHQPGFQPSHILYYLGGLIAIGAMSLFMNMGFEQFGGAGLCAIALAYAVGGLALTHHWLARGLRIPAGLAGAFVVVLTPMAVYGLQQALGLWDGQRRLQQFHSHIDWRWLLIELATLATSAILLWRYRLPFMVMPLAVTLWYMSMDLAPFLIGAQDPAQASSWAFRAWVSVWFGLGMTLLAFWVDVRSHRSRADFAFWLYLFGVITFWGGLSMQNSNSELGKLLYLLINLGLIAIGAVLSRRVFAVFGGLGVAGYLGHLAHSVFRDSLLFPFVLTFIGLGVIGLGLLWQRHEARISQRLRAWLPPALQTLIERQP